MAADLSAFLVELNALLARYGLVALNGAGPVLPSEQLVSLDQCAALVHLSRKSLYHYRDRGLPEPARRARRGQPFLYDWNVMRPWLEQTFGLVLPVVHPAYSRPA